MGLKLPVDDQSKGEELLDRSGLNSLESRPVESDRLHTNFLRWLRKSYPGDYHRFTNRHEIPENEIRDFLKSKGIDVLNIYYLMKSLKGG